jgi:hypothetical protein
MSGTSEAPRVCSGDADGNTQRVGCKMTIRQAPAPLNPLSEMLALSAFRNTKNVIISMVETRGPLDHKAMTLAVARTAEKYPQVLSCIKEVRIRGRYRLFWQHHPDLPLPVNLSQLQPSDDSR